MDRGNPSLNSTHFFTLRIEDYNDHAPVFDYSYSPCLKDERTIRIEEVGDEGLIDIS